MPKLLDFKVYTLFLEAKFDESALQRFANLFKDEIRN